MPRHDANEGLLGGASSGLSGEVERVTNASAAGAAVLEALRDSVSRAVSSTSRIVAEVSQLDRASDRGSDYRDRAMTNSEISGLGSQNAAVLPESPQAVETIAKMIAYAIIAPPLMLTDTCEGHPILKRREIVFMWWLVVTGGAVAALIVICTMEDLFAENGGEYLPTRESAIDIFFMVLFTTLSLVLAETCRHIWFREDAAAEPNVTGDVTVQERISTESWRKVETQEGQKEDPDTKDLSDVGFSVGNFVALATLFGLAAQFAYFQVSTSQRTDQDADSSYQHHDLDSSFWPPIAVSVHHQLERFFVVLGSEILHKIPFELQFWVSVGMVWFWLLLCSWVAVKRMPDETSPTGKRPLTVAELGNNYLLIYTHKLILGLCFIPIMRVLIHGISCRREEGGDLVVNSAQGLHNHETKIMCWSQQHKWIAITSVLTAEYFACFGLLAKCTPQIKRAVQGSTNIDVLYAPRYEAVQIFCCLVVAVSGTLEVGSPVVASSIACLCAATIWICVWLSKPCLISEVNTLINLVFGITLCISVSFVVSLLLDWRRDLRQIAVMAIFGCVSLFVWIVYDIIRSWRTVATEEEQRAGWRYRGWLGFRVALGLALGSVAIFVFAGGDHNLCKDNILYGEACPLHWDCNSTRFAVTCSSPCVTGGWDAVCLRENKECAPGVPGFCGACLPGFDERNNNTCRRAGPSPSPGPGPSPSPPSPDPCDHVTCNGHGHCVPDRDNHKCECDVGWNGEACNDATGCDSDPDCGHGSCVAHGGSHECDCDTGYDGTTCSHSKGCDDAPCQHGGECSATGDEHSCNCAGTGYSGLNCETKERVCASEDCSSSCGVLPKLDTVGTRSTFSALCSELDAPGAVALHSGFWTSVGTPITWTVPGPSGLEGLAGLGAIYLEQNTKMEVNGPETAACGGVHIGCPSDGSCPSSDQVGCAIVRARFEVGVSSKLTLSHIAIIDQTAEWRHKTNPDPDSPAHGTDLFPAPNGGAIMIKENGMATLIHCEIIGNVAHEGNDGSGGAIDVDISASLTVRGSIFAGNRAHEHGGAIYIKAGTGIHTPSISIVDTAFCENSDGQTLYLPAGREGVFWNEYAVAVPGGENNCFGNTGSSPGPALAKCWPEKETPQPTCSVLSLSGDSRDV
jgi:hypothetical protein